MKEEDKNTNSNEENVTSEQVQNTIIFFIKNLLIVKDGIDYLGTQERIEKSIPFKGVNVWILICSIMIASIGLNANSTAVIIGAMLISPLMGPVVGVGFAVGTNEFIILKDSLKNFGIMVVVSLVTSWLYFTITPLNKADAEILARTSPTFLDVLVALFGGLAGIIAVCRKESSNVIPGVAIATALMPPLCTVGYGLATGQIDYILGALYLFILNCSFIALSATLFVRFVVNFPLHAFVDAKRERKVKIYLSTFLTILIIPSFIMFYRVIVKSVFETSAQEFIEKNINHPGAYISSKEINFASDTSEIKIAFVGETVPQSVISNWQNQLNYQFIERPVSLMVIQSKFDESKLQVNNGFDNKTVSILLEEIQSKENVINTLESRINAIKTEKTVDINKLQDEINTLFPGIDKIGYAKIIEKEKNKKKLDTVYSFFIKWDKTLKDKDIKENEKRINNWLEARENLKNIRILTY